MSAALPPMHAALSVLGTMAGQYLAAQAAQAQSTQPQPQSQPQPPQTQPQAQPQPQPAFNATTRQTATNAVNLCDVCHAKPKYFDGTKTHSYCSKTCATKIQNQNNKTTPGSNPPARGTRGKSAKARAPRARANMCDYCHKQPKYNDGKTTHSFCSKTCAQQAKPAGGAPAAPSKPLKNGCLLCGKAVKKGHFCGQACSSKVEKSAPLLIEVPNAHDTFKSVADQFKASWRHQSACPTVRHVYKVIGHPTSIVKYDAYRASVEARGKFAATGRSAGNENRRWHGTTRECLLGDNGNTGLCPSASCSLCGIIRTSYSLNLFGKKTGWGRFGAGIYTSSTSSKSNDYSSNIKPSGQKAILLNKVVVGKGYKMTQDNAKMTAPPPGYDSVLAEVVLGGSLNYDELVCYAENAIRPSYLLIYDA
ncbi:ADP-ribosylation [Chiua virens]|nr:ADP-ribosylation [Chiua virens]